MPKHPGRTPQISAKEYRSRGRLQTSSDQPSLRSDEGDRNAVGPREHAMQERHHGFRSLNDYPALRTKSTNGCWRGWRRCAGQRDVEALRKDA